MTTLASSWTQARGAREVRPPRPPLLLLFVSWLARRLPSLAKARTVIMQFAAFGIADYAVFEYVGHGWGLGAIAASLLILETLISADARGKARR